MKTKAKSAKASSHRKVMEKPPVPNESTDRGLSGKKNKKKESKEAEITKDDLDALGTDEFANDTGEDEPLKQRTHPVDFAGEDLDVPGAEADDAREEIGAEDEENNPYSLGGDRHED